MKSGIHFTGKFAPLCETFLKQKQALGYSYSTQSYLLKRFDDFSNSFDVVDYSLSRELVLAWIKRKPNEVPTTQSNRKKMIRQFAIFLNAQGYQSYVLPKQRSTPKMNVPYIFTKQEIEALFAALDNTNPSSLSPHAHEVMALLFRLLYGCGLRISEAVRLRIRDVDLKAGVLTIRKAKHDKDRLIPMSKSVAEKCRSYFQKCLIHSSNDDFLFQTKWKKPYRTDHIGKRFRELLREIGIPYCGRTKGPRLHDLRHTFAVHCLNQWATEGIDVQCALPYLSTYLGHNSVSATGWYLRLTAEVYPQIVERFENQFGQVMPEYDWSDNLV
ncbi:tyrosine-type recombinase/integrase [Cohnella sp.]|uniref:tyrosine-type recombinase/integrase n=1 Tax=Cohnella sp. TaxID=1883426 RepID=UPI0035615A6D